MKDNIKSEIGHLWGLIQHRNKWYIDFTAPDDPDIQDVAEKAKENADAALSDISATALYGRYKRWVADLPPVKIIKGEQDEKYYDTFLSDVVYNLGLSSLRGKEKKLFYESVNLFIRFL